MDSAKSFLYPDWPAPSSVKAAISTRLGGISVSPYDSFNLGMHVGDDPGHVQANREQLRKVLGLVDEPVWLDQVHGTTVVNAADAGQGVEADASVATVHDKACVVMTADCLPALFCNRQGTVVAAAHAGWRGLAAGVLEQTVSMMSCPPEDIMVWMGPAIGPGAFEVGVEVRHAFVEKHAEASAAFNPFGDKWLADIYRLARIHLAAVGVNRIFGGNACTYTDRTHFYSYRRDGVTGRMASLIWLDSQA